MMVRHTTNFSFVLELSDTVLSYKYPSKLQIITSKRTRALYIQKNFIEENPQRKELPRKNCAMFDF